MSTFYSLFDSCDGERVALRATRFVSKKSMSFTFTGWCKLCEKEHTVERRAPAGSFKTNTSADPRMLCHLVDGAAGSFRRLGYKLAIPYSNTGIVTVGNVRFAVMQLNRVRALDPIPASWFVDLSLDVIESTEPEEFEFDGADVL